MFQAIKRVLSLVLCVLLLVTLLPRVQLWVAAEEAVTPMEESSREFTNIAEGTCGENLNWSLSETGTLTISGTGQMSDYSSYSVVPWYQYRSLITDVVIQNGVTSIGSSAFYSCSSLTEVTIPEGVTSIGTGAFENCSSLTEVTIPDGVTSIGSSAFYSCSSLTEVTFLGAAPELQANSFHNVRATVYYPCNDKTWTNSVKQNYGGTLVWVVDHVFGDDVITQDATCEQDATETVTCLRCDTIETTPIPGTALGHSFDEECVCMRCQYVQVLYSGTCGTDIRWTLDALGTLTISGTGPMSDYYSYNSPSHAPWYQYRSLITDVVIQNGVTRIGGSVFEDCISLTTVTIPDGVTSIGTGAFENCSSLTEVTIPDGVTSIGTRAFENCSSLTTVTISGRIISIGEYAFGYCRRLTTVTFLSTAPTFYDWSFKSVTATVYYPCNNKTWTSAVKGSYAGDLTWKANHTLDDDVVMQDATCNQDATETGLCLKCDTIVTISIPDTATGHSYEDTVTPPTCTQEGFTTTTCTECGESNVSDTVPVLEHSFGDNGLCQYCGNGPDLIISMQDAYGDSWNGAAIQVYANGDLVTTATVGAGRSAEVTISYRPDRIYTFQWVRGSYDSECSFEIIVKGEVLFSGTSYLNGEIFYTMKGTCVHQYVPVVTPATCIAEGSTTYTCTTCGDSYTVTTPAAGHSLVTTEVAASCTEYGFHRHECEICGYYFYNNETPSTGHSYEETVTKPTCTEWGATTYNCTTCGDSYTVTTPAAGHSLVTTEVAASCTEHGFHRHECEICGYYFYNNETNPTGHNYQEAVTPPTCTEEGITTYACADCGDIYTVTASATGHSFGEYISNNDATCTVAGTRTATCSGCGITDTLPDGEPLGHSYNDSACTLCGKTNPLVWDISGDEELTVVDVAMLYAHVKGTKLITDEETLKRTDVTNDGNVNIADVSALYAYITGTIK